MKAFQTRMESVKIAEVEDFKEELKTGTNVQAKPMAFTYGGGFFPKDKQADHNQSIDSNDPKYATGAHFPKRPVTDLTNNNMEGDETDVNYRNNFLNTSSNELKREGSKLQQQENYQ